MRKDYSTMECTNTVYYIGGSPCSGKSTIAQMLCDEFKLQYYKSDDFLFEYMDLAAKDGKPYSKEDAELDFEGMWMREPMLQADRELAIYEELWPYAEKAIQAMSADAPVVAEGAGFMPKIMAKCGVPAGNYVCIVPTEAFQRENYAKREWIGQCLVGCKNPDAAFDNWMTRDALYAKKMLLQAQEYGYKSIIVDGTKSLEENYGIVKAVFGISPY